MINVQRITSKKTSQTLYHPSLRTSSAPRLFVFSDIGADPDDQQSLIRLLLHSNDIEIEGLVATASGTPGELPYAITQPCLIRHIVRAYASVYPTLALHDPRYPHPDRLLACVASGNRHRGHNAIGPKHDTDGSRALIAALDRNDPRPLHVALWGGQTDLAQALWRLHHDRGPEALLASLARLRIYDIADQDHLADYIHNTYPSLFYILSNPPPGADRYRAAFRGMYLGGDESLTSRAWLEQHVKTGHGALGALYPMNTWTAPNPHGAMKECDTPSWFYILPNGLSDPTHPEWGSWGGRFLPAALSLFRDARDTVNGNTSECATVWRWRPAFQNEFAARLDWCVTDPPAANHPPQVIIEPVPQFVSPGTHLILDASRSSDPDGDSLNFKWWVYPEPSSYPLPVSLAPAHAPVTELIIPPAPSTGSLHVILEVTDSSSPPLTRYARLVFHICV
ncbi:MAG: DUF1593 domain-containing protein [bacterium]|nr:DUF1593 domain-containing protein [bacterium]